MHERVVDSIPVYLYLRAGKSLFVLVLQPSVSGKLPPVGGQSSSKLLFVLSFEIKPYHVSLLGILLELFGSSSLPLYRSFGLLL